MEILFNKTVGKIKPMHAVNNMPLRGTSDSMHHYVKEAGIPLVRLHDTGGMYGANRFVDIENIFRDFSADENDPASYDFAFTDWLLNSIDAQNSKIFYRLGTTIENSQHIKAYRIFPPKDNLKWAKICEKIIAHYNEGWADGFKLGIKYWEIWNEPDNYPDIKDNCMWKGTFEEYLELYKVTSRHLRERFPDIKIGGYASCGFYSIFTDEYVESAHSSSRTDYFVECFHKFMKFVKENDLPLDFFSWHSYSGVEKNIAYEKYVHEYLTEYGYENTESILNEWNPGTKRRGTLADSAYISEMMLKMQDTTCDMLMYYNGDINGVFNGLYNPLTFTPFKAYYVLKAFNELYNLENQVYVNCEENSISCVAAVKGDEKAIVITNTGEKKTFEIQSDVMETFALYRISEKSDLEFENSVSLSGKIKIGEFETILLIRKDENK